MATEQGCDLGFHRLRQQRAGALAQNIGQRIGKSPWLAELENITLGHGVSLLRWRSGGVEYPHDTPPNSSGRHQISPIAPGSDRRCATHPRKPRVIKSTVRLPLRSTVVDLCRG